MLKTEAFINGMCCLSPQKTFENNAFPHDIIAIENSNYLKCSEPLYKNVIDPMIARRMSRIVKMGIYASKFCMSDAGVGNPDAVITGTGLGCVEDTEKFLMSMIQYNEKTLNPTPFILSTHNTISSQISLFLKCNAYNSTYSQKGLSFESALFDSLLMLREKSGVNILVGSADEITNHSYKISSRLGIWKKEKNSNLNLLHSNTNGSIAGEGTAFFLLSDKPAGNTYAKILGLKTLHGPYSKEMLNYEVLSFLQSNNISPENIDLALLGVNGDKRYDMLYDEFVENIFKDCICSYYKHLCGEYYTSMSFAMWLASVMLKSKLVPDIIRMNNKTVSNINRILIYNNYYNHSHSFILLQNAEL